MGWLDAGYFAYVLSLWILLGPFTGEKTKRWHPSLRLHSSSLWMSEPGSLTRTGLPEPYSFLYTTLLQKTKLCVSVSIPLNGGYEIYLFFRIGFLSWQEFINLTAFSSNRREGPLDWELDFKKDVDKPVCLQIMNNKGMGNYVKWGRAGKCRDVWPPEESQPIVWLKLYKVGSRESGARVS